MKKRTISFTITTVSSGRPEGTKTFDQALASSFGYTVRQLRKAEGLSQEDLAHLAGIERSHMGKIERGYHAPNLSLIFRIARALDVDASQIIEQTEQLLAESKA